MKIKQYIVDAFTGKVFSGNPAAICVLKNEISDNLMQKIAIENNLSETAFITQNNSEYNLRWFTPAGEIDLCGHATLASAFVILNIINKNSNNIIFNTMSGKLLVEKSENIFKMTFPAYKLKPVPITSQIIDALGTTPFEAYMGRDLLCILDNEETIKNINPNLDKVKELDGLLLHISVKSSLYDCVSRSFAPKCNVNEDPVCGSGHCHIVPYWAKKLNKDKINAYQASKRSGVLYCEYNKDKVILGGNAVLFAESTIVL